MDFNEKIARIRKELKVRNSGEYVHILRKNDWVASIVGSKVEVLSRRIEVASQGEALDKVAEELMWKEHYS
jgi:hypothetical protein